MKNEKSGDGVNYTIKSEEYLLSISNKGILNRSNKDLENLDIKHEVKDDCIEITFPDNTVIITEDLTKSSCTCPSSSVCKHIVTSLLYLNRVYSQGEVAVLDEFDDSEIKVQDHKKLFKTLGGSYQKEFLQNISSNTLPIITKNSLVTIELSKVVTIKILNPLDLSTCTCQSKTLCKHKALAYLYYLFHIGVVKLNMFEVSKSDQKDFLDSQKYCLEVKNIVIEALRVGLSRTSDTIVEKFERAALYAQVLQLAKLSNMLRDVSGTYNSYFNQDIYFKEYTLLNKLVKVNDICNKIIQSKDYAEFSKYCGVFREEYVQSPILNLVCIAVKNISTKSGYVGMGSYYLDEESMNVYSFSSLQPNFYDNDAPIRIIAPWGLNCGFEDLEGKRLVVRYPKTTADGRISSSKDTTGRILSSLAEEPLKDTSIIKDFSTLITMNDLNDNQRVKVIRYSEVESFSYSIVKQSLIINVLDNNGYKIACELKKTEGNSFMYTEILNLLNAKKKFDLVGSIYQASSLQMYIMNFIEVIV